MSTGYAPKYLLICIHNLGYNTRTKFLSRENTSIGWNKWNMDKTHNAPQSYNQMGSPCTWHGDVSYKGNNWLLGKDEIICMCWVVDVKVKRRQRPGIITIKYHTWPETSYGKMTKHKGTSHTREQTIMILWGRTTRIIEWRVRKKLSVHGDWLLEEKTTCHDYVSKKREQKALTLSILSNFECSKETTEYWLKI